MDSFGRIINFKQLIDFEMAQMNDSCVKILHRFYSDMLEQDTVETMWAVPIDVSKGLYRLDSIPFYAKSLAVGDTIYALYDNKQQALVLEDIVEFSGHSTVQIILMDAKVQTEDIRAIVHNLGCMTEKQMDRYFAGDIPDNIGYRPIKEKLIELKTQGIIDFREACLSDQHRD